MLKDFHHYQQKSDQYGYLDPIRPRRPASIVEGTDTGIMSRTALLNGTISHMLDYDDVNNTMFDHHSADPCSGVGWPRSMLILRGRLSTVE
jgi:2-methylcitrate dehydratase PrpD